MYLARASSLRLAGLGKAIKGFKESVKEEQKDIEESKKIDAEKRMSNAKGKELLCMSELRPSDAKMARQMP